MTDVVPQMLLPRGRWLLLGSVLVALAIPAVSPLGLLFLSAAQQYKEAVLPFREHPYNGNKPLLAEYDFIVVSTDRPRSSTPEYWFCSGRK